MGGKVGEECRDVCQSAQIFHTPLLSGIHTTETSAGSELSQAAGRKNTHEAPGL